jgi:hypothetical protein
MTEREAAGQLEISGEDLAHHVLRERTEHMPWVSLSISSSSDQAAYVE